MSTTILPTADAETPAAAGAELTTTMPLVFRARSVVTASGTFGHLRIRTFNVDDPDAFVDEFAQGAEGLAKRNVVIVDVGVEHVHVVDPQPPQRPSHLLADRRAR